MMSSVSSQSKQNFWKIRLKSLMKVDKVSSKSATRSITRILMMNRLLRSLKTIRQWLNPSAQNNKRFSLRLQKQHQNSRINSIRRVACLWLRQLLTQSSKVRADTADTVVTIRTSNQRASQQRHTSNRRGLSSGLSRQRSTCSATRQRSTRIGSKVSSTISRWLQGLQPNRANR